jgi:hypothetical protein
MALLLLFLFGPQELHDLLTGQCLFIRHIDLKLVTLSLEEHARERTGIRSTIKSADGPGDLGS